MLCHNDKVCAEASCCLIIPVCAYAKDSICSLTILSLNGSLGWRFMMLDSALSYARDMSGIISVPRSMQRIATTSSGRGIHRCQEWCDLWHVGCQDLCSGFLQVVINEAFFLHTHHSGGKVVIQQDHICCLFGDIRT